VAAVAPIIAAAVPGKRVPQVVLLIFLGILIGPHGRGLASPPSIELLSNVGLGFLFLLAGYELDPHLLRERPGRLAMIGWAFSAALAVGVTGLLTVTDFVYDYVPIGLALTTTALGTLLPILRDNDMLSGRFGRHVLAAGAAALVGAGVLSVLIYPSAAAALRRCGQRRGGPDALAAEHHRELAG
jgi:Kef-type K+ transport system membrane component KefB